MTKTSTDLPRTDALDDAEIRRFLQRGHLFPGQILDREETTALRERLDEVMASTHAPDGIEKIDLIADRPDEIKSANPAEGKVPLLTGLWKTEPLFGALALEHPTLLQWVRQLLGTDDLTFLVDNAIIKEPGVSGDVHWHQDWSGWPMSPVEVVTCWIALEDITLDNGAMEMASGTHTLGKFIPIDTATGVSRPNAGDLREQGMKDMPDPADLGVDIVPVVLREGECSLHHGLLWHRSGTNRTDSRRHSYIMRYSRSDNTYEGSLRSSFYDVTDYGAESFVGQPVANVPAFRRIVQ